jgi:hypothetical protein
MSKIILDTISNTLETGYIVFKQNVYCDLSAVDTLQLPVMSSKEADNSFDGELIWNTDRQAVQWYANGLWNDASLEQDYDNLERVGSTIHLDTYDVDSYTGSGNFWNNLSIYFENSIENINGVFYESGERSFYFDATDKVFSVSQNFSQVSMENGTGSSYSFWFKSDPSTNYGSNSNNKILFSVSASDGTGILKIGINPSGNGIYYYDNNLGTGNTIGSSNYNNNAWTNLTITRPDGNTGQTSIFYINGVQIGTLANTNPSYDLGTVVRIGSDFDGTNNINNYGGYLSFVLINERSLTPSEVTQNYDVTRYRYGL